MRYEMISYLLCDVNSSIEDYASATIWKSAYTSWKELLLSSKLFASK